MVHKFQYQPNKKAFFLGVQWSDECYLWFADVEPLHEGLISLMIFWIDKILLTDAL